MWVTLAWIIGGALSQVISSNTIRNMQAHSRNLYLAIIANYAIAMGVAGIYGLWRGLHFTPATMGWGIFTGFFYTVSLLTILRSMGQRGLALTVAMSSLSLLIPTLLSLTFGERMLPVQFGGIAVAVLSIPMLALSTTTGTAIRERPNVPLVGLLFLLQGGAMSGNLFANKLLPATAQPAYLLCIFAAGLIFASLAAAIWRQPSDRGDIRRGIWFGLTNIGSTLTILLALAYVPGALFFAAMGVVGLMLSALVAVAFWRERLQRWGWCGMGLAMVATVLLNLKG